MVVVGGGVEGVEGGALAALPWRLGARGPWCRLPPSHPAGAGGGILLNTCLLVEHLVCWGWSLHVASVSELGLFQSKLFVFLDTCMKYFIDLCLALAPAMPHTPA